MTETHIAGELYGLSAHPGDIYHRAAMTVYEALIRERDEARQWVEDVKNVQENSNAEGYAEAKAHYEGRISKLEADNAKLREALTWYSEQSRLARLIHSEGDDGRKALADDGGRLASAALENKP